MNYTALNQALLDLKGIDKNQTDYLGMLHELLLEHFVLISKQVGRMKAKAMLLETAKGRKEFGMSNDEIIEFFGVYHECTAYLELINKISGITQQKVKILTEK